MKREPREPDATRTLVVEQRVGAPVHGLTISIAAGPDAPRTVSLARRVAVVGRARTADVVLSDPTVSSFHAEISACEDGLLVRDLQSRNGTRYAGAKLREAVVPAGASIAVGSTTLALQLGADFQEPLHNLPMFDDLRGTSAAMRELFAVLARLAPSDLSILVQGPTGSGKELVARAIHRASRVADGPFVVLDCTAVPSGLAESILFGHERGAFTGAAEQREGVFQAADGGTLFLDEVGDLPGELQPKLLRALERREIVRVGSTQTHRVNVRVVAATWRDLRRLVNTGAFREDLYYRIAQACVPVPPLCDRPEDIPALAHHFLQSIPRENPGARILAPEALDELARRDYPGNIRELRHTIERAAMLAAGPAITPSDLAFERMLSGGARASVRPATRSAAPPAPSDALQPFKTAKRTLVDEFERDYLARLLERTGDNLSRAAALSGVDRRYLRELCRKHGLRDDGE